MPEVSRIERTMDKNDVRRIEKGVAEVDMWFI
jgi:hypothetical protein